MAEADLPDGATGTGTADDTVPEDVAGVSIGVAAARLGVTVSTLRSWGRRYQVGPSLRTTGGHRRYSPADLAVLDEVQAGIVRGEAPARAAADALARSGAVASHPARDDESPRRRNAGPGGRVLAVPGADPRARGLARASGQLDLDAAEHLILEALRERGVPLAWEELVRPVLVAVGRRWAETGAGIEVEHVLSEAALGALRRRRAELPEPLVEAPVLLSAAPHDQHTLSLHVLATGLAERRQANRVLGAQVPLGALASAARRTRPTAIFVSSVMGGGVDARAVLAALPRTRPPTRVVLGGPGWATGDLPAGISHATDLADAIERLVAPHLKPAPV